MDEEKSKKSTVRMSTRHANTVNEEEQSSKDDRKDERKREDDNRKSSHRHDRSDRKNDEKLNEERRKLKSKFEQIQTQLSSTEIQMYDYKMKLNDLMKENASLREQLESKIERLEESLNHKSSDYLTLRDEYDRLRTRLIDQSNTIEFSNESSNQQIESSIQIPSDHESSSNFIKHNDQNNNLNVANLIETNRRLAQINEQLKTEIHNLESELDESSDRYREDQENEFKEMKYKLEASLKNTRLLQFKLSKLERAYNQMKVENHHLSSKLKKATELNNLRNRPLTPQTEITKTELDRAKEVLLRMHLSLQTEKGEKMRMSLTIKRLEEQLNITKSELIAMSMRNQNQIKTIHSRSLSPQTSIDRQCEEKIRDLEERESDLQEQLKFSEEESNSLRKKLSSIEQENEILTKQIQTLCNSTKSIQNEENSFESMVVMKVEQDEQLNQLKKELEEQKKQNQELERKLIQLQALEDELIDSKEFIKRGSGELIRKGSGEIIRRDSGASDFIRRDSFGRRDSGKGQESGDSKTEDTTKLSKSISNTSLNVNPKVEKVLLKENFATGSLFYEEKIENLERQLQKLKNDLYEKEQENENLMNLIELRKQDKSKGKRFTLARSSSLQD